MTEILTSYCILAVGHSARDVFEMLYNANISMVQKNFAVGMRIEHSQDWLNHAMYGREASPPELPVADYKLAVHLQINIVCTHFACVRVGKSLQHLQNNIDWLSTV